MLQNATMMLHQKMPTIYAVVVDNINNIPVIIVTLKFANLQITL